MEHLTMHLHKPRTMRSPLSFRGGSLNAFFFLLIGVISQRLARVRKKRGTRTLGGLVNGELYLCDGLATPGKRIEDASNYFMHAPLGSGGYNSVGRALLLQLGHCDYMLDDQNVPLKDSTETKMGCQDVDEVGWAVGQI
ncbi:hypothetical protein H5410_037974 [Solanum commersonii]|uniref:Uncharacterized protein n=1 Tax=Solanum commersonii TaxID=4109 RepID=A0A9J5YCN0_SOLCO|nr:hypothetical protein H5410_037974 [Solanum commersonii]